MQQFNLFDSIVGVSRSYPERVALVSADRSLTYREFLRNVLESANYLRATGVGDVSRVGIALSSSIDAIIATYALWCLGKTVTMLDPRSRAEERARLSKSMNISIILEAKTPAGNGDYQALRFTHDLVARAPGNMLEMLAPKAVEPLAMLKTTSGTTGTPVGIGLSHHNLIHRIALYQGSVKSAFGGSLLLAVPLHFSMPFNRAVVHLLEGGTVHLFNQFVSGEELIENTNSRGIERMAVVPSQLRAMLKAAHGASEPVLPNVSDLVNGGAATSAEESLLAYQTLSSSYQTSYGSTLTGRIADLTGGDLLQAPGSVGRPNTLIHLSIVDKSGIPVEQGESGTIRVRGPGNADCIIGEPRELSDRFEDGWAVPGDIGRLDQNGVLHLTGRAADVIIRGGGNVYPQEVEAQILTCSGIAEVVVAGIPDKSLGEEVIAFVAPGVDFSDARLQTHITTVIPADKRPRHVKIIDEMPYNAMGKIQKRQLVENYLKNCSDDPANRS